ncbi:MAG: hypothetical protein ACOCUU_01440 [Nanoarchaeota archaeon]
MSGKEIKISVSESLDKNLQKIADELGIKKAELVKNFVVKELIELNLYKNKKN